MVSRGDWGEFAVEDERVVASNANYFSAIGSYGGHLGCPAVGVTSAV